MNYLLTLLVIFFTCSGLAAESYGESITLSSNLFKSDQELFKKMNNDFYQFTLTKIDKEFNLEMYTHWDQTYPAASTHRDSDLPPFKPGSKDSWIISSLAGYWRDINFGHPMVHLLVLCHELAHHIGGAPYKYDDNGKIRWASMEPQADYFATLACIPEFVKMFPFWIEQNILSFELIHPALRSNCDNIYNNEYEFKLCVNISQAALNLAYIHHEYALPGETEGPVDPLYEEDKIVIELDRNNYPSNQCRFDTHIRGALKLERPSCWFPN